MNKFRTYAIVVLALVGLAVSAPPLVAQKSSALLTNKQLKELVTNAKTPADHVKLQKHFLALATKYEAEAADHMDLAGAYRKNPNGVAESKRPGGPETAVHCDRFADLTRQAAKEARELASAHEHMAAAAK